MTKDNTSLSNLALINSILVLWALEFEMDSERQYCLQYSKKRIVGFLCIMLRKIEMIEIISIDC